MENITNQIFDYYFIMQGIGFSHILGDNLCIMEVSVIDVIPMEVVPELEPDTSFVTI